MIMWHAELSTWLRQQIKERRRIASNFQAWPYVRTKNWSMEIREFFDAVGPDAVLAQCDSHERLIAMSNRALAVCATSDSDYEWAEDVLCTVAMSYRNCPGYREEWRP